ncbi:MAG: glycosyltransferase family 2 protein [bacterium]
MKPPLAVIQIVNYNGRENLKDLFFECYESVFSQSYTNFKVHVIDNNSTDDSVEILKAEFPEVKVTEAGGNFGYTANNFGLKYFELIEADYLLVMNSDVILERDCLKNLIHFMENNTGVGAANPMIMMNRKRDIICSTGINLNEAAFSRNSGFLSFKKEALNGDDRRLLSGACMILRKNLINKTGLFDFDFKSYYEDADLSLRILSFTDFKLALVKEAECFHEGSASYSKESRESDYLMLRNQYLIILKRFPIISAIRAFSFFARTRFLKRNLIHLKIAAYLLLHSFSITVHRIKSKAKTINSVNTLLEKGMNPYFIERMTSERTKIIRDEADVANFDIPDRFVAGVTDNAIGEGFSMLLGNFPLSRRIFERGVCYIKNNFKEYILSGYPDDVKVALTINKTQKISGTLPMKFKVEADGEILELEINPSSDVYITYAGGVDGF